MRPQSRPRSRLSRMRQERAERLSRTDGRAPLPPAPQHEDLYFLTDEEELRYLVEVCLCSLCSTSHSSSDSSSSV